MEFVQIFFVNKFSLKEKKLKRKKCEKTVFVKIYIYIMQNSFVKINI